MGTAHIIKAVHDSLFSQLVVVAGAGKSSLLAALLGEMEQHCGHMRVQGRVAYVPQQPWILTGTFRWTPLLAAQMHSQPIPLPIIWRRILIRLALMLLVAS